MQQKMIVMAEAKPTTELVYSNKYGGPFHIVDTGQHSTPTERQEWINELGDP